MAFHVGQKVVCVDARSRVGEGPMFELIKGGIYTVRQTGLRAWTDGSPAIRLDEIVRGPNDAEDGGPDSDTPFYAFRFRPLIERKTSTGMAILRKIADDASNKTLVPVDGE